MPARGPLFSSRLTRFRLFGALVLALGLGSCTDSSPIFDVRPVIEVVSIRREFARSGYAANQVQSTFNPALGESVLVTVSFRDGDGDLGGEARGPLTWIMRDRRDGLPTAYPYTTGGSNPIVVSDTTLYSGYLPSLLSDNRKPSIEGEISYRIPNVEALALDTCLGAPSLVQVARFDIYIVDRAGNRSNVVTTPPLSIRCQ